MRYNTIAIKTRKGGLSHDQNTTAGGRRQPD